MSEEEPVQLIDLAGDEGEEVGGEPTTPAGGKPEVEVKGEGQAKAPPLTSYSVKTNGGCFICLGRTEDGGESSPVPKTIQEVYSYLKLNWRKVWTDLGPAPPQIAGWGVELKVELCLECSAKMDKFKELLGQLEEVRRRVDSSLQLLVEQMQEAEKDPDSPAKQQFWKGMMEEDPQKGVGEGNRQVQLVKELRERAIVKVLSAKGEDGLFRSSRMTKSAALPSRKRTAVGSSSPSRKRKRLTPVEDNKTCRICCRKFISAAALRRHIFIHLAGVFPFQCPRCPNKFKLGSTLSAHVRKAHRDRRSTFHDLYGRQRMVTRTTVLVTVGSGADTQTKNVEIENHSSNEEGVPVPALPKKLRPPPGPKLVWKEGSSQGNLRCHLCQASFLTVTGLQSHYKRSHQGLPENLVVLQVPSTASQCRPRPEFRCPLCSNTFEGEISLREHRKICPVRECPICSNKFGTGVKLANHMQDVHTDAGRRGRR